MFQRTRYQERHVVRIRRSRVPDYWALRWWEIDADGKRVHRKTIIGRYPNIPPKQVLGGPRKLCASPLTRRRPSWPNAPYRFQLSSSITSNMSFVAERRRSRNRLQLGEPIRISCGFTSNRSGAVSSFVKSGRPPSRSGLRT